jgi:flagellar biosynthetic protein FlhB
VSEDDDSGEKTFDPTPAKLEEARRKGDVARSMDANAAAAYLGLLAAVVTGGAWAVERSAAALTVFIDQPDRLMGAVLGPGGGALSAAIVGEAVWGMAAIFAAPAVAVLVSLFAQQAFAFSGEKLAFKGSRLSPLANAKQKFGPSGLMEFGKSAVKLGAISAAVFFVLSGDLDKMIGAATADPRVIGALLMDELVTLLAITCAIAVAIGGVDLVWQRFDHARKLGCRSRTCARRSSTPRAIRTLRRSAAPAAKRSP